MGLEEKLSEEYDKRFSSEEQGLLRDSKIEPALANSYHSRFEAWEIENLVARDIINAVAIKYPNRFSGEDITWLSKNNITPDTAITYDQRFSGQNITSFIYGISAISPDGTEIEIRVPPSEANKYSQRFSGSEVEKCVEIGLDANHANQYGPRFDFYSLWCLWRAQILPETANAYPKRFSQSDIVLLVKDKISPQTVLTYQERFGAHDLLMLVQVNITPQEAAVYSTRYSGAGIAQLRQCGVSSQLADQYPIRFSGENIALLCKNSLSPQDSAMYPAKFSAKEIVHFKNTGISLEEISLYPSTLNGTSIIILYKIGITQKNTPFKDIEDAHNVLNNIVDKQQHGNIENFTFLGTGRRSMVVLNNYTKEAYKFSRDLSLEEKILSQVKKRHGKTHHVINLIEFEMAQQEGEVDILKLEYIKGKSLQPIVESQTLSSDTIFQYARDILHGLVELHQAGIVQHRDLRPANILVEENDNHAVIIDLGIATTEKEALPKDNDRFGGPNDLVSLGQVMYFMATRQHLFTESDSMHVTRIKRDIKDERERVYADLTGKALEPYLRKVDLTITNPQINVLVKSCLRAKGTDLDYQTLEEKFK